MIDVPMPRKRILVVANPTAGPRRRGRLQPILRRLEARDCAITLYETKSAGDAERYVRDIDGEDFDAIAAGGGDGTINEVLNGLPPGGPPLAILPLGTVNVLAKEIGLPASVDGIAETVVSGPSRPISIGEVNGRRFAVMASVGLDADVVERVSPGLKRRIGKGAYLYETMKRLASLPLMYRLNIDDQVQQTHGVIIANGRFYAGRYVTAPDAHIEKPRLDICRLDRPGRSAAPRYLLSLFLGRLARRADVRIDQAMDLEILGPAGAPVQADGDVICHLPASIRVLPAAVDLVFPTTSSTPSTVPANGKTLP